MYTLKSDAGHIERMTSLPAFATRQQDVYIWSRGDGLQHLQWNVSLQVLWLGHMQIWWLPWRWFVIGTGEICIFNLLHVAYIAKWVIFCVHGNRTTNIFLGCIGVLMFGRVLLSRVVLQVIVHLAITSLLHLHCFVFDLHSSRQTHLTWWKCVSGRHNHSL